MQNLVFIDTFCNHACFCPSSEKVVTLEKQKKNIVHSKFEKKNLTDCVYRRLFQNV